jgi:hypothetical protein
MVERDGIFRPEVMCLSLTAAGLIGIIVAGLQLAFHIAG